MSNSSSVAYFVLNCHFNVLISGVYDVAFVSSVKFYYASFMKFVLVQHLANGLDKFYQKFKKSTQFELSACTVTQAQLIPVIPNYDSDSNRYQYYSI